MICNSVKENTKECDDDYDDEIPSDNENNKILQEKETQFK